jgi:hypothetical protein
MVASLTSVLKDWAPVASAVAALSSLAVALILWLESKGREQPLLRLSILSTSRHLTASLKHMKGGRVSQTTVLFLYAAGCDSGSIGSGFLDAGDEWLLDVSAMNRGGTPNGLVACYDRGRNLYVWTTEGRYKKWGRRPGGRKPVGSRRRFWRTRKLFMEPSGYSYVKAVAAAHAASGKFNDLLIPWWKRPMLIDDLTGHPRWQSLFRRSGIKLEERALMNYFYPSNKVDTYSSSLTASPK